MLTTVHCPECNAYYRIDPAGYYEAHCSNCGKLLHQISEYGFGDIVPMQIWIGELCVARLTRESDGYHYRSVPFHLHKKLEGTNGLSILNQTIQTTNELYKKAVSED